MKVLTIQDISCYGECSITVALPILSSYGIETVILPNAILSTHTGGFKGYTNLDLTDEMRKIIDHFKKENIKFDAIYTGYMGNSKQIDIALYAKKELLKKGGLFIVDPAMADNGHLYPALDSSIVSKMKELLKDADLIIPNITEAKLLSDTLTEDISKIGDILLNMGVKNIVITSYMKDKLIGNVIINKDKTNIVFKKYLTGSYHGSGDIFSSSLIANYLKGKSLKTSVKKASNFVIQAIKETKKDPTHWYGLSFEKVLDK